MQDTERSRVHESHVMNVASADGTDAGLRTRKTTPGSESMVATLRALEQLVSMARALSALVIAVVTLSALTILASFAIAPESAVVRSGQIVLSALGFVMLLVLAFGAATFWLRRPSQVRQIKNDLTTAFYDKLDTSPLNPRLRHHAVHG